jgi:small subunit ribosomal protein S16
MVVGSTLGSDESMVRLRFKRMGRRHRPFYRLNAMDQRSPRDGRVIENLGWYDPITKDETKQVSLNVERIKHWLSVGAQPSDTVADLLARHEIIDPEKRKAVRKARLTGKLAKMEVQRKADEVKAAEEAAAAKVEADKKAAAEAEAAKKAAAEAAAEPEASGDES